MGAESAKTYSLQSWTISLFGIDLNGGAAEDGIFDLEPSQDLVTEIEGADGTVVISDNNLRLWKGTLKLLPTSQVNAKLSTLVIANRILPGAAMGPAIIKDGQGATLGVASTSWIRAMPKLGIAKKPGAQEWGLGFDFPVPPFFGGA